MTNTPQPGTIPARAIAWMQAQPPGSSFAAAVLADALDIDRNVISPILQWPVKKGAILVEKREGRLYWSLPISGQAAAPAAAPPDDDEHDDAPPVQRIVPAASAPKLEIPPPAAAVVPSLPPSLRPGHPKPARKQSPKPPRVPVPAKPKPVDIHLVAAEPSRHDTRLAVWSDGAMTIERGPVRLDFTLDETRRILAYLDHLSGVAA